MSVSISIRMVANTAASNTSMRLVGDIFSYCTASSTFSCARTFEMQYSNGSAWK